MNLRLLNFRHFSCWATHALQGWLCVLWLTGPGLPDIAIAQTRRDSAEPRAIDRIWTTTGWELRGSIVEQKPEETRIAVRRQWLQQHQPTAFEVLRSNEQTEITSARETLQQRLHNWLAEIPRDHRSLRLKSFLEEEQLRLKNQPDQHTDADFLLATIPSRQIRRLQIEIADRRQLAAVAWELGIADVETTSASALQQAVEAVDSNWTSRAPWLAARLPAGLPESLPAWELRQAIIEHRLLDGPLELQGTGDLLLKATPGEAIDWTAFLKPLLTPSLVNPLQSLSQPSMTVDWRTSAIRQAEAAGRRSVRVTRVQPALETGTVTVSSEFLIKLSNSGWHSGWSTTVQGGVEAVRRGALDQIRADPQIQPLHDLARQFGFEATFDTALHVGALTLDLNQEVQDRWLTFSDRYLKRLDAPLLPAVR